MIRYQLGDVVREWAADEMWLGALPDGPIGRFGGVGALVLEILDDRSAYSAQEILEILQRELTEVPPGAGATIDAFLEDLADQRMLRKISA